jgi:hypothetical protein
MHRRLSRHMCRRPNWNLPKHPGQCSRIQPNERCGVARTSSGSAGSNATLQTHGSRHALGGELGLAGARRANDCAVDGPAPHAWRGSRCSSASRSRTRARVRCAKRLSREHAGAEVTRRHGDRAALPANNTSRYHAGHYVEFILRDGRAAASRWRTRRPMARTSNCTCSTCQPASSPTTCSR